MVNVIIELTVSLLCRDRETDLIWRSDLPQVVPNEKRLAFLGVSAGGLADEVLVPGKVFVQDLSQASRHGVVPVGEPSGVAAARSVIGGI
jgi:hypothetical protein